MKLKIFVAVTALLAVSETSALAQGVPTVECNGCRQREQLGCRRATGYNWQQGPWVYGVAADISGTHLKSQANAVLPGPAFFVVPTSVNSDIDWYGTVRGRLGWSSGPLLFYGTAGLAYGGLDSSSSLTFAPVSLNAQTSSVRAGWVAGGGIDYMWRPNVLVSLEYQYVDLGTLNVAVAAASGVSTSSLSASEHARFSAVTVGVSRLSTRPAAGARSVGRRLCRRPRRRRVGQRHQRRLYGVIDSHIRHSAQA